MSRNRLVLNLSWAERQELEALVEEGLDRRMVLRGKIVLMTEEGIPLKKIADDLGLSKNTVNTWRQNFLVKRLQGLKDRKRTGRPSKKAKEIFSHLFG